MFRGPVRKRTIEHDKELGSESSQSTNEQHAYECYPVLISYLNTWDDYVSGESNTISQESASEGSAHEAA
jgi:hypothetical protein